MAAPKRTAHLVPPLFEQGAVDDFKQSGRTLSFALSPRGLHVSVFASPNVRSASNGGSAGLGVFTKECRSIPRFSVRKGPRHRADSRYIWRACSKHLSLNEELYVLYHSGLSTIVDESPVCHRHVGDFRCSSKSVEGLPCEGRRIVSFQSQWRPFPPSNITSYRLQSEDGMKALNKLANDYVNFCKECCMYASVCSSFSGECSSD